MASEQLKAYRREWMRKWRQTHPAQSRIYKRNWRRKNSEKNKAQARRWWAAQKEAGTSAWLAKNLRTRIYIALKGTKKLRGTTELLSCSIDKLKKHLEEQFAPGMTWENYGAWHVDHKLPCAAFDLTALEGQRACFHFSNLQPLWAKDNLAKWDRI